MPELQPGCLQPRRPCGQRRGQWSAMRDAQPRGRHERNERTHGRCGLLRRGSSRNKRSFPLRRLTAGCKWARLRGVAGVSAGIRACSHVQASLWRCAAGRSVQYSMLILPGGFVAFPWACGVPGGAVCDRVHELRCVVHSSCTEEAFSAVEAMPSRAIESRPGRAVQSEERSAPEGGWGTPCPCVIVVP